MNFTLYTADCTGNETNCLYPHKAVISSPADLARAAAYDHVAAAYWNDYRSNDNFISADAWCGTAITTIRRIRTNG